MNFKTTLILLILLLIAGGYFYATKDAPSTFEREEQQAGSQNLPGDPLFTTADIDPDKIDRVTVETDGKQVTLAREDDKWQQVEPVRFPVHDWAAQGLVAAAVELRFFEKLGESELPVTKEELKLAPPVATVTLTTSDNQQHTLQLGKRSVGKRGYVTRNDEPNIYVVTDDLHRTVLEEGIDTWRVRSASAPGEGRTQRVVLRRDGNEIAMTKAANGQWHFEAPHSGRASSEQVRDLLGALGSVYMKEFVADKPDDLSRYGLDKPWIELVVQTAAAPGTDANAGDDASAGANAAAEPITLSIGAAQDLTKQMYYATLRDSSHQDTVVFAVLGASLDRFKKKLDDLRDPRVTPVTEADVHELMIDRKIRDKDESLKLKRSADAWQFEQAPVNFAPDTGAVTDLIKQITSATAQSFVQAPQQRTPRATVTLRALARTEPEVLNIYVNDSEGVLMTADLTVVRGDENVGYVVPATELAKVFEPMLSLRNRTVLDVAPGSVRQVTISQPEHAAEYEMTFEGEKWSLKGHDNFEQGLLNSLLRAVAPLQAERWLSDDADLGEQPIVLTFVTADKTYTVRVNPKNRHAQAEGISHAFVISQELARVLPQEYRDRTVLKLAQPDIVKITTDAGKQTLTIERQGDKFVRDDGGDIYAQPTAALFDAVAGLRVQHYVDAPRQPKPTKTVTVSTADHAQHQLQHIPTAKFPTLWRLSSSNTEAEKYFTLDQAAHEKLTAELAAE